MSGKRGDGVKAYAREQDAVQYRRRKHDARQKAARDRLAYDGCWMTPEELAEWHRQLKREFYEREAGRRAA